MSAQQTDRPMQDEASIEVLASIAKMGICFHHVAGLQCRVPASVHSPTLLKWMADHRIELQEIVPPLHRSNDSIAPLAANTGQTLSIFLIHPMHGGVYDYRHTVAGIPSRYAAFGIHALGHLLSGDALLSVEAMADKYIAQLTDSGLMNRPFALYGASDGGFIALEMARRLAAVGKAPLLLALGDTRDKNSWDKLANYQTLRERVLWVAFIEAYFPQELTDVFPADHPFWGRAPRDRFAYITDRVGAMIDPSYCLPLDVDILGAAFDRFRDYVCSYAAYRPAPYSGRSLFFHATAVPPQVSTEIRAALGCMCRDEEIAGTHVALLRPPGAMRVGVLLAEEMQRIRAPQS